MCCSTDRWLRPRRLQHVLLTLGDGLLDDQSIQLLHLPIGDEPGVVVAHRIELVVFDADHRLLAAEEVLFDIRRRDDDEVDLLSLQPLPGLVGVVRDLDELDRVARELGVEVQVTRQAGAGRQHQHRVQGSILAAVAQAKQAHDQKRTKDQAEERARSTDRFEHVLADEGRRPGPRLKQPEQHLVNC
jgi:hypothetical protein